MSEEEMVSAGEICKRFPVPRYVLYRLVKQKKLAAYEGPRPKWDFSTRRYYLFKPSEVEAALRQLRESRPEYG